MVGIHKALHDVSSVRPMTVSDNTLTHSYGICYPRPTLGLAQLQPQAYSSATPADRRDQVYCDNGQVFSSISIQQ